MGKHIASLQNKDGIDMGNMHVNGVIGQGYVLEYRDNFSFSMDAMKALGELLVSSPMDGFCGDGKDAMIMRSGLKQIIDLMIEKQERDLVDLVKKTTTDHECIRVA